MGRSNGSYFRREEKSMFIRSRDEKHVVKAQKLDVEGKVLLINGVAFETFASEAEAIEELSDICQAIADDEEFYDLAKQIVSSFDMDDEDDFDEFDDDDDPDDGPGGVIHIW